MQLLLSPVMAPDLDRAHAPVGPRCDVVAPRSKDPEEPLLHLPTDVMRSVLQRLLPTDRAALRGSCRAGRAAANTPVGTLVLYERDLDAAAKLTIASSFPDAKEVRITLDGSSGSSLDADADGGAVGQGSPAPAPPTQLPGRFAGSCTLQVVGRRLARGAVERRAAAVIAACSPEALRLSVFTGACGAQVTDVAVLLAPPGAARLRRLWVRAPQIQEPAVVAIGRLSALEDLCLASSGGITTCHLSSLASLTSLKTTVTAPLAPALAPLAALTALRALQLRCISPCGSWGAALVPVLRAAAGGLRRLQLNFATLEEADVECFKEAAGLEVLDLTSCRHLTPGCIRHIADLTALKSLHLEHTGLILAHPQLQLLGSCRQLSEVSVDSVDLCALRQEEERLVALAAAAGRAAGGDGGGGGGGDGGADGGVAMGARVAVGSGVFIGGGGRVVDLALRRSSSSGGSSSITSSSDEASPCLSACLAARWPPLRSVQLHSTSSYLNLQSLLRSSPGLRHLTLLHYVRWDEAVDLISTYGSSLESLHISGCSGLSGDGYERLGSMPRLRQLALGSTWLPADRARRLAPPPLGVPLGCAGASCCGQQHGGSCDGPCCSCQPGEVLGQEPAAARACQRLESLQLEHCTSVGAATARALARLPWLRRLTLRDCPDLTEEALLELSAAPRLARLDVINCGKVPAGARGAVLRERSRRIDDLAQRRQQQDGAAGGGCDADADAAGSSGGGGDERQGASCLGGSGAGAALCPSTEAAACCWPVVLEPLELLWDGGSGSGEAGSW